MIQLNKAVEIMQSMEVKVRTEKIPVTKSLGRVLAEDVFSGLDSPPFAKSAMDGFAYNSDDEGNELKIIETIPAGHIPQKEIKAGECSKIMTGAMIPKGADKVVKIENCTIGDGCVRFQKEKNDNIIKKGENLKTGEKVLEKCIIRPQEIGILSSLGLAEIEVARQPLTGVITTGTELKNPGKKLEPGQIYNSNGYQISAQIEKMNCKAKYFGTVPDDPEKTFLIIKNAMEECDVLILSGGVSMGDFDFVPKMLERNGVDILLHKVAIKPGKPTLFGEKNGKFVFGLPGNPVSTFIIFEVFIKPFLFKMMGLDFVPHIQKGILSATIKRKRTERVEYFPVLFTKGEIFPVKYHGSAHLNLLGRTNALIKIEQGISAIIEGSEIDVRQIQA